MARGGVPPWVTCSRPRSAHSFHCDLDQKSSAHRLGSLDPGRECFGTVAVLGLRPRDQKAMSTSIDRPGPRCRIFAGHLSLNPKGVGSIEALPHHAVCTEESQHRFDRSFHDRALTQPRSTAYPASAAALPSPGTTPMTRLLRAASLVALTFAAVGPAAALSSKECSTKYQAAKQAGTLGSMKWNDFRKAECGAPQDNPATTVPNPLAPSATNATQAPAPSTMATKPVQPPKAPPSVAGGSAVFPRAVDPKYSAISAGKARQKTCLDQYNANKATGGAGNGGLNWIQKGGGYYSECNKHLKS